MQLEFLLPTERLTSVFANYYRVRSDDIDFEETDRADVAHLRFLAKGEGHVEFFGKRIEQTHRTILTGPGTAAATIRLKGPVDAYGISLLPTVWDGGLFPSMASDHVDRLSDPIGMFGDVLYDLPDRISDAPDFETVAAIFDEVFEPLVRQLRPAQEDAIETIREWLGESANPEVPKLFERVPRSEKQIVRYAKAHFGAPPKMLARKFRALKAAQAIYLNDGEVARNIVEPFYDQSHMSREIKRFTGRPPGKLASPDELMLQTLIKRPYFFRETIEGGDSGVSEGGAA